MQFDGRWARERASRIEASNAPALIDAAICEKRVRYFAINARRVNAFATAEVNISPEIGERDKGAAEKCTSSYSA